MLASCNFLLIGNKAPSIFLFYGNKNSSQVSGRLVVKHMKPNTSNKNIKALKDTDGFQPATVPTANFNFPSSLQ